MSLDGSPGEDHIVDWDGGGFAYAFELPLLYADRDLSGDISDGDDIAATACVDGLAAGVIWFPPTDDIEMTAALHTFGVPLGWNAVVTGDDEGLSVLSDTEASAILNDLYDGNEVDEERQERLLSLFRMEFRDETLMRPDIAGRPVYLGLAMTGNKRLKLKPQNLLVNLPLAPEA